MRHRVKTCFSGGTQERPLALNGAKAAGVSVAGSEPLCSWAERV